MTLEVIKTEFSDVVIIRKGIQGNAPFVVRLDELDELAAQLYNLSVHYRDQIDKYIDHKAKQTEEIMKLIEPVYSTEWDKDVAIEEPVYTPSAESASEFNDKWTAFEADLTGSQKRWYLELSQTNKQKAFDYWTRTEGEHCVRQLWWYQRNYEQ